jgi:Ca2+-binding EF-hand superfamily protein
MGSSQSKTEDPACQLAKKYRFPKKTGEKIIEHFQALDVDSKGFLTKDDFDPLINQLNPISQKVLDAFFYPPDDLDPEAEPLDSIDLEHFFKVTYLFFLYPTKRSCRECRDIFTKPLQVFVDSEDKKNKRLMMLFRMIKPPDESFINKTAFANALEVLKITRETDESIEEAFREIERISEKTQLDFGAFKKECSKYQIDDLFVNEVRDTHDNQVIF